MNSSIFWNAHLPCTSVPKALMMGSVSVLKQTAEIQRWHPPFISVAGGESTHLSRVGGPAADRSSWAVGSTNCYQVSWQRLHSQQTTANIWVSRIWTIASQSVGWRSLGIHVYWRKPEQPKFFVKIEAEIHPEIKILLCPRQVYQFPGNDYQIILMK